MRIITGKLKGRRIHHYQIPGVRPTRDFVKTQIFNILTHHYDVSWPDCHFLDFCAGSGQIGIEALSHGAKHVTFIDTHPLCRQNIQKNLNQFSISPHQYDIAPHLDFTKSYDVCFMDPPYDDTQLYQWTLYQLKATLIVVEMGKKQSLPTDIPYMCDMEKRSGKTKIVFLVPKNLLSSKIDMTPKKSYNFGVNSEK